MRTKLITGHVEHYSPEDPSKELGVFINYNIDGTNLKFEASIPYIFKNGNYIFFETLMVMFDYFLNGNVYLKRAYLPEDEFDALYDAKFIDGLFVDKLDWIDGSSAENPN
jgi:hypothetical protein